MSRSVIRLLRNLAEQHKPMRYVLFAACLIATTSSHAQWTVAFHQSFLPFAALSYSPSDRFRIEARVGTDLDFNSITAEGVLTYDVLQGADYQLYAGLGGRTNGYTGLVLPAGLNLYPFASKRFGFHLELAALIGIPYENVDEDTLLRGSWGIRYRFMPE